LLGTTARDIIFQYTYPRLDSMVSVGLNHLLKAPFCAHPKTGNNILFLMVGRICVPIDPNQCKNFNPMNVPTLTDLISQMDQDLGKATIPLMKPHLEYFKGFLKSLGDSVRENQRAKRIQEEKKLMF
jgi:DNA primase small subunit